MNTSIKFLFLFLFFYSLLYSRVYGQSSQQEPISNPPIPQHNMNSLNISAGITYAIPTGDLKDFFEGNFAYALNSRQKIAQNFFGKLYLMEGFQYLYLKSDDIRESSHLKMFFINAGVGQEVFNNNWYSFLISLKPELWIWNLHNNLSSSYDASDKGLIGGLQLGVVNSFSIYDSFDLDFVIQAHTPKVVIGNSIFAFGLQIGKTF